MADILLISVSKDASRTDALAARFQKAGLSIGDVFSPDPALHLAAAGVLVWSENSHHSLFFRDAANRLFRGGAAVVAGLTNVPPPACFDGSLSFDLSRWQGDPCDPALDPLEFAIQQMVVKDLCAQAQCWRSLRGSRDPSALRDYLGRYGPDGAFSALVRSRLERLALEHRRQARAPAALLLAPARVSASTLDTAPSRPSPSPAPANPAAGARVSPAAAASPVNSTRANPVVAPGRPERSDPQAVRTPRLRMMLPLLIGAALVGAAYFGALGVSKYAFGPTESLAAPTDPPVLYLDEPAAAQPSAQPLLEFSPAQPVQGADQAVTASAGELRSIPSTTSPGLNKTSAALTSLDAPAMASLQGAPELAAAPMEVVDPPVSYGDVDAMDVDATPVPDLGAPAPLDGAAGAEPVAADVELVVIEGLYGPHP